MDVGMDAKAREHFKNRRFEMDMEMKIEKFLKFRKFISAHIHTYSHADMGVDGSSRWKLEDGSGKFKGVMEVYNFVCSVPNN